ncbi:MAG: hypothetical protein PHQ05_02230 [Sterolibacterium sp.]|nr:hypothetical protein [Sterolibacterium sp.]
MSTINFSVPDDVKKLFNTTFAGQNKNAIIADLMLEAVERAKRKQRSHIAIANILSRREMAPTVTAAVFRRARDQGRPLMPAVGSGVLNSLRSNNAARLPRSGSPPLGGAEGMGNQILRCDFDFGIRKLEPGTFNRQLIGKSMTDR